MILVHWYGIYTWMVFLVNICIYYSFVSFDIDVDLTYLYLSINVYVLCWLILCKNRFISLVVHWGESVCDQRITKLICWDQSYHQQLGIVLLTSICGSEAVGLLSSWCSSVYCVEWLQCKLGPGWTRVELYLYQCRSLVTIGHVTLPRLENWIGNFRSYVVYVLLVVFNIRARLGYWVSGCFPQVVNYQPSCVLLIINLLCKNNVCSSS